MYSISILAVFALVFSCTFALDVTLNDQWKLWKQTHNKQYSDIEEHLRRDIWENNLKNVQGHNLQADLGVYTYRLGMNQFSDLTGEEYTKMMTGYQHTKPKQSNQNHNIFRFNPSLKIPDTVDWRDKGYVTPVKNQGQCAPFWAFSALGALEGQHFNATGKLISLSAQQVVDCSGSQGNAGCVGGFIYVTLDYIKQVGGIQGEDTYPYEDDDNRCRFNVSQAVANVTGYTNITSKDENALQQAVATIGPIAVAIDASHKSFQMYKTGVYDEIFCSERSLNHNVLVVGYGVDSGKDYWLVKNSWGTTWGDQGYIKMTRNKRNQCGIATAATYPLV